MPEMQYFAVLRFPNGKTDIRGPMQEGDTEDKMNKVFASYLMSNKVQDAPSIELIPSLATTKEEFIQEYQGGQEVETLGR
jgi:hypothetical protein